MKRLGGAAPSSRRGGFSLAGGIFLVFGAGTILAAAISGGIVASAEWNWLAGVAVAPLAGLTAGLLWFATPYATASLAYAFVRPFGGVERACDAWYETGLWTVFLLLLGYVLLAAVVLVALPVTIVIGWFEG